jgi:hypothetical protein
MKGRVADFKVGLGGDGARVAAEFLCGALNDGAMVGTVVGNS